MFTKTKLDRTYVHTRMVTDFNDEPDPKTGTTKQGLSQGGGRNNLNQ